MDVVLSVLQVVLSETRGVKKASMFGLTTKKFVVAAGGLALLGVSLAGHWLSAEWLLSTRRRALLGGQDTDMCEWIDLDLPKPVPGTPDIARTNPGSILAGPAVTVVHSVKNSPRLSKR